jgi:D-alanine-D-alanine ligase
MSTAREVVILSGAVSGERDVSLRSGRRVFSELDGQLPRRLVELEKNALPGGLDPARSVVFPLVHGDFGEDGQLQRLLEERNLSYVGSGSESMELTIRKGRTKERVRRVGVPVLPSLAFSAGSRPPSFSRLCEILSAPALFLKPDALGSSLFCRPIRGEGEWEEALGGCRSGDWLVEPLCRGREFTVGLLGDRPLAVLEIVHGQDFLSYAGKYAAGGARHLCPAPVGMGLESSLKELARLAFTACGCRDWARVDLLLDGDGRPYFLEINAIPGFTATSLYPDSALGAGFSPPELLRAIVARAWESGPP